MNDLGRERGNYLIDIDNDGKWEYIYNPNSGSISEYEQEGETKTSAFPWMWLFVILVSIVIGNVVYYEYKKIKNKIVAKIALCPKCETRVPVNGRKGQNIKVTCSDCGGRGVVKL